MISSPLDKFYHWEKTTPGKILFRQPVNGRWREYSFAAAGNEIRRLAASLKSVNLPPGSNIAILSKNCAHWIMADLAIWMAGHVSVPLYPTLSAASIRQILDHSDSRLIFLGKLDDYSNQKEGIPASVQKISFPWYGPQDGMSWEELVSKFEPAEDISLAPETLITIMYTSGTTGIPKGVMFNAGQLTWTAAAAVKSLQEQFGFPFHAKLFSYLPLSHIAERMITEVTGILLGASVTFVESLDTFAKNLAEVQPHLFFGVPRIYMKFQEKILEKLPQKKLNTLLRIPVVSSLLRARLKKTLGFSDAKVIGVGAAPFPAALVRWFDSLGIPIRDIYGMTENAGFCSFNLMDIRVGTVGQAWPGVEIKLDEGGEILSRHPGTMIGYYKEPELTREIFSSNGFLKTGDVGTLDADGFLSITGRVKDIFKTDKGKYVAPGPIETKLMTNVDIEQVCVVGMGIPQPIALIVLSITGKTKTREEIAKSLQINLEEINEKLETYEKLETMVVLQSDWTIENGLLTPTLKVKRNEVEKIFLPNYPRWYAETESVVWE